MKVVRPDNLLDHVGQERYDVIKPMLDIIQAQPVEIRLIAQLGYWIANCPEGTPEGYINLLGFCWEQLAAELGMDPKAIDETVRNMAKVNAAVNQGKESTCGEPLSTVH